MNIIERIEEVFEDRNWYWNIGGFFAVITALVTFVSCWWYAVASWGFLIGVAFGWIPAIIIATMAAAVAAVIWLPAVIIVVLGLSWVMNH